MSITQIAARQLAWDRLVDCPTCYLCGKVGTYLYRDLQDRQYDVPGTWNIRRCSNPACGLLWLDPCPPESELSRLYETYYTHKEPTQSGERAGFSDRLRSFVKFGPPVHRSNPALGLLGHLTAFIFPPLISHLPTTPGRLLDLGCGSGDLLQAAKERGWDAEGLDFDPLVVETARRRGLPVHLGSIASRGYRADSFDAVVMSHVVEHVSDPVTVLQECRRVLKPGRRLVLATPNADSWFHRIFGKDWYHLDPPRHLFLFGTHTLSEIIRRAGFAKLPVCSTGLGIPYVYDRSAVIQRKGHTRDAGFPRSPVAYFMMLAELTKIKKAVGEELRAIVEK